MLVSVHRFCELQGFARVMDGLPFASVAVENKIIPWDV
jgi:hypothetical protein